MRDFFFVRYTSKDGLSLMEEINWSLPMLQYPPPRFNRPIYRMPGSIADRTVDKLASPREYQFAGKTIEDVLVPRYTKIIFEYEEV